VPTSRVIADIGVIGFSLPHLFRVLRCNYYLHY